MNLDRILFTWGVGSYGWGVVGINFMLHWPGMALSTAVDPQAALPYGDPRASLLAERIAQSRDWQVHAKLMEDPLFVGLGNDLGSGYANLRRLPMVAFPVFEDVECVRRNIRKLDSAGIVITASNWNRDVLAENGVVSRMVHQGYDPVLFNPGIRRKRSDGRFRVFSGGKAEYRKGQDLVLEGFKIFAEKYDDAVLHAAWASPWPLLANEFAKTPLGAPPGTAIGFPDFKLWANKHGIKTYQFEMVPATPNHLMPLVLADMDCAVFASRVEGGTNIAAMECLGCGIPTILSWSTGHKDLPHQFTVTKPEEIAEALELARTSPDFPKQIRGYGIDHFEWPARIGELVGVLKDA